MCVCQVSRPVIRRVPPWTAASPSSCFTCLLVGAVRHRRLGGAGAVTDVFRWELGEGVGERACARARVCVMLLFTFKAYFTDFQRMCVCASFVVVFTD